MHLFKYFGDNISYKDIIQLDGSASITHIN